MTTLIQRINARFESRQSDEKGLALLDVLLGMAIFALIVVIGVQNFSTLRERAYTTQVSSDVKQSATAIQAFATSPNAVMPADLLTLQAGTALEGVNLTSGNAVGGYTYDAAADSFTICVERTADASIAATYDSATSDVTMGACA